MKVLLSGYHNPNFITVTEYIERAIIKLGHELIPFDDRKHIIPGRFRYKSRILNNLDLYLMNKRLMGCVSRKNPQLAIITGGNRTTARSLQRMKDSEIVTVLWTTDYPGKFENIQTTAPIYDHIFCQGTEAIELLTMAGIHTAKWLPMACAPEYHHPVNLSDGDLKDYSCDIAFVGSKYPNRLKLFESISDLDIAIWGPGWDDLDKNSTLRSNIKGGALKPEEWRKIYSGSKIVLTPHFKDPENKINVHQVSPKLFEAMACGAFVITDMQKDGIELFRDGQHLIRFNNSDDLREKIIFYLNNPKEREKIAAKGREEVLSKHTYAHRIQKIVDSLQL